MAEDTRGRVRAWEEISPEYEQRWRDRQESRGMTWDEIMPGYWYGYEMAWDVRYQDRPWRDVESEVQRGYPSWAERHGYGREPTWERIKDAVREAWDTVAGGGTRRTYKHLDDREVPTTEMGLEGKRV